MASDAFQNEVVGNLFMLHCIGKQLSKHPEIQNYLIFTLSIKMITSELLLKRTFVNFKEAEK